MSKLRIGMIALSFSPGRVTPFPGVNRYSVSLANALISNNVEVRVITPLLGNVPRSEIWRGIEITRLRDSKTIFGKLGVIAEANFRTFEANLLRHPEILEDCNVLHTDIPLPRLRSRWHHRPLVGIVHHTYRTWVGIDLLTVPFGVMYQRRALKRADAIVTPSSSAAEDIVRVYKVGREKVKVIHHGVDTDFFRPRKPSEETLPKITPVVLYVGLLETRKGVGDLVPIFARVSREEPASKLVIVGIGPNIVKLKNSFERYGLSDRVHFEENLTDRELATTLNASGVFVSPSRLEGFGLSVAEAMACGKPVVAYDNKTNREVIGDAGILVPEGDHQALASSIVELLRQPTLSAQLGEKGRRRAVEKFDWNSAALQYLNLDHYLLNEG